MRRIPAWLLSASLLFVGCSDKSTAPVTDSAGKWYDVGGGVKRNLGAAVTNLFTYQDDLVAAGWFDSAGTTAAGSIARWDGSRWKAFAPGAVGPIEASAELDGSIFVCGHSTRSLDQILWRWNGTQWDSLAPDMQYGSRQLIVYNGSLIVLEGRGIARWSGSQWEDLTPDRHDTIEQLAVIHGSLVAVGVINDTCGVGTWNGTGWSPLPEIMSSGLTGWSSPKCVAEYGDRIVVGGQFKEPEPGGFHLAAAWDGCTWRFLDKAANLPGEIQCLGVYDGCLIAGGEFGAIDGVPANSIACWDGRSWSALGTGIAGTPHAAVVALATYGRRMFVGGFFFSAGGVPVGQVAAWERLGPQH